MTKYLTWIKNNIFFLIVLIMFLFGIGLLAYPSVASGITAHHQGKLVHTYRQSVSMVDSERYESMIAAADQFNRELAAYEQRWTMPQNMLDEYTSLLRIDDTGIIGYVTIKKINVKLPLFHGTDQKALDLAVCHVAGSSLPSDQPNTHTVVTGHRSRVSSKLFRDLDELEIGDKFSIIVLNRRYVYTIDQIQVVVPSDLSKLDIEEGQNYCTLVTCTPYGSESHRLLVRGHLISPSFSSFTSFTDSTPDSPISAEFVPGESSDSSRSEDTADEGVVVEESVDAVENPVDSVESPVDTFDEVETVDSVDMTEETGDEDVVGEDSNPVEGSSADFSGGEL